MTTRAEKKPIGGMNSRWAILWNNPEKKYWELFIQPCNYNLAVLYWKDIEQAYKDAGDYRLIEIIDAVEIKVID